MPTRKSLRRKRTSIMSHQKGVAWKLYLFVVFDLWQKFGIKLDKKAKIAADKNRTLATYSNDNRSLPTLQARTTAVIVVIFHPFTVRTVLH